MSRDRAFVFVPIRGSKVLACMSRHHHDIGERHNCPVSEFYIPIVPVQLSPLDVARSPVSLYEVILHI